MLFITLRQYSSNHWRMAMRHCRYTTASCPASSATPLQPDRPIGFVSLVDQQVPYDKGLDIQTFLVNRRHQLNRQDANDTGDPEDIIVFLQHPPTYTAGRRIRGKTELEQEQRLRRLGADYFETMRGGQITYHGPGQLIAYPILDIRDYQINVRCYVSRLEKTIIDCCKQFGVEANTTENTGVWVGQDQKIAALGVHLQRYVSSHGVALNCNVDLDWYEHIVPCGLADKKVTSLSEQLNRVVTPSDTLPILRQSFERLFQVPLQPINPEGQLASEIKSIIAGGK
ncbi:hypothetical protein LRAMOSA02240 [Lichtheimia ramosa]|uniref:lipoyl(octanoyl) transferase n=1 Tax=Lichtheimia ramosa TaxID=688394 RepID=A0A077WNE3_9FUNG|nr:hypothetical protein LRAMOSA02240 [Lichtheimia ramosa]